MLKAATQKTKNPESWSGSYFHFGVYINANVIEERCIGDSTVVLRANSVIVVIC